MFARTLHFLRPTFVALIGFGLLLGVASLTSLRPWPVPDFVGAGGLSAADLASLDLTRVVLPRPDLAPDEVVRLQLGGLSDPQADGVGILQCYCFASPSNRAITGPLERFGRMVRQGPYRCLTRPRALLVGQPQYGDRVARLLVTVIDHHSSVQAFMFVLTRQQASPFEDCWMTEAVLPALPVREPAEPAGDPAA
jgi:hypothetical protein